MAKEWTTWQQFHATKPLSKKEYEGLTAQGARVIGTRWVLTRKDTGYKARLVVQGCQEDKHQIRSDAPTGSLLGFFVVLAIAAQQGWSLSGYDAASALLQSEGIHRTLLLRMPGKQPPPGTVPFQVLRALGSIYGTRDAGRSWYKLLKRSL